MKQLGHEDVNQHKDDEVEEGDQTGDLLAKIEKNERTKRREIRKFLIIHIHCQRNIRKLKGDTPFDKLPSSPRLRRTGHTTKGLLRRDQDDSAFAKASADRREEGEITRTIFPSRIRIPSSLL